MQSNSLIQAVAEQIHGKKGAPKYPYIMAKRNIGFELTCDIHDMTWEGLRPTGKNGKRGWEIFHDFTLIVSPDGACFIPDTKNNREKLERMQGQETVDRESRRNLNTGRMEEFKVRTTIPPLYERVEKSMIDNAMVKEIAIEVAKLLKKQEEGDADLDEDEVDGEIADLTAPVNAARVTRTKLPDPPKRKSRKNAELTEPIRG